METMRLGRNDLCRCGSGKKFKKCCLAHQQPVSLIPTYRAPPPPPRRDPSPGVPVGTPSLESFEHKDVVFVKGKGWTHESELKPGDQYRLKCGGWETVPPDRVIGITEEHPFYVQGKGWTPVREIKPGDLLRTEDGWVPVKSIEDTGRYETVYNLRVADHHTYFVGTRDWGFAVWAHNACNHLLEELGTDAATKAFRNNSRGFRDAVEHAATGDRAAFERVLAADGIKDQATAQRLWDDPPQGKWTA